MSRHSLKQVLLNPRMLAMIIIGFSSGLPLALTGATLQAWYTTAGVSVVTVGALTLAGLPYVWKFLWAPVMDRFTPGNLGRRRGWILITQIALAICLFVLALMDPKSDPLLMALLAFVISFFSASQDISVDAYRVDILSSEERGVGAAVFISAYRGALIVAGGIALIVANYAGWRITYELMAALMLLSALATCFIPSPPHPNMHTENFAATIKGSFGDLWQRDSIVLLLLFALLYKFGDAFAVTLLSNFLLKGIGFSLAEVGWIYKTAGIAGTLLGAMFGGILMIRIGLYRSLMLFGFAQAFSILAYMMLALVGKNAMFMAGAVFIEYFCNGMGTAAFVAFLMSLCHPRYSATQYACLSALTAAGRVLLGPLAGVMVLHLGWASFFAWSFLLSFPGLIVLWMIRNRVSFNAEAQKV